MNNIITALSLTLLSALPVYAQLETLGPSPLPVMPASNGEIRIPDDSTSFDISFPDEQAARESIHAILGFISGQPSQADVGYYPTPERNPGGPGAAPCWVVGAQNNGNIGIAVWKVILPDSSPLRGGVAEFNVAFVGRPNEQKEKLYVAVTDSYSPNAQNTNLSMRPSEESMGRIAETSEAHGTYRETISVPLPQGATELFLIVADAGSSARMAVTTITLKAPADKQVE